MSPVKYSQRERHVHARPRVRASHTQQQNCVVQRTVRRRDHTLSAAIGALTIDTVAVGRTVGAAVIVVTGVASEWSTKNSGKPGTQWTAPRAHQPLLRPQLAGRPRRWGTMVIQQGYTIRPRHPCRWSLI